jgi:hypothetical protein
MAKYNGIIGFTELVETAPGVWRDQIIERTYKGDLLKNSRRLESSGGVNDNVNISNQISIVADPYAKQNFHSILYATFMGARWKVSDATVNPPRIILTLGGLYNGKKT